MALKDCLRELGVVSPQDEAKLKLYLADGMTDEQAVQRLLIETSVDVISIVDQVRQTGVEINTPKDMVAEVRDLQDKRLRRMVAKRAELEERIEQLNKEYQIYHYEAELFDHLLAQGKQLYDPVENMDDAEILMRIGQVMFNENTRNRLSEGWNGFQGDGPKEVLASWHRHKQLRIDNRKRHTPLAREWQAASQKIDDVVSNQVWPSMSDKTFNQELTPEGAQVSTDQQRIASLLGPALYGNQKIMGKVTVKELFQNSFDATRAALEKGLIDEADINITISDDGRTVTVEDNGVGMTPDMIRNGLLTIGGTQKEGTVNSGGFGIAKMLFLFGAENLEISTVRDGVRTSLTTTGKDVMANAADPEHALDQSRPANEAIQREESTSPSGTTITVQIPDEYTNLNTGEQQTIDRINRWEVEGSFEHQLLHPKVNVQVNGLPAQAGAKFPMEDWTSVGQVQFEWGTADILVTKEPANVWNKNIRVLTNGLAQFDMAQTDNPGSLESENINRRFVFDIHPNSEPDSASYPFDLNRQGFKEHAQNDLQKLQFYLAVKYREDQSAELAKGYGTLIALDENNQPSEQIDVAPEVPDGSGLAIDIDPDAKIEIVDGELYVDDYQIEQISTEELENQRFDASQYQIDQGQIPSNSPLIHNSLSFKADTMIFPDRLVEGQTEAVDVGGMDLYEVLKEQFGEERINAYYGDIGRQFVKMKNLIAGIGDDRYAGLENAGAGVSALGSGYYGVHTRIPATMIFINPFADPHDLDGGPMSRSDLPEDVRMQLIASSMMTTMVHEIAHYIDMTHHNTFIFALQGATALLDNTPTLATEIRESLRKTLRENNDIYKFVEGQFQADSLENTGLSLRDVGTEQARDGDGAPDATQERGAEAGQGGAAGQVQRGAGDTGQQLDPGQVPDGDPSRESVGAWGSVDPNAGTDIPASPQENLEAFMEGSVVVNEDGSPQVVYHGTQFTDEKIEVLEPQGGFGGWNNMGTWFSSERDHAERLTGNVDGMPDGPVIEAYLSIKNPLETTWDELQHEISTAIENHNRNNPNADELVAQGSYPGTTSRVGIFLREHFKSLGYDGIIMRDWDGDGQPTQDVFVAFDSNQAKESSGTEFNPDEQNIYKQGRRGSITFDSARRATINLYEAADLTTFIHEAGHLYLELFDHLYNRPDASEQILRDGKTLLNHFGLENFDQVETKHHEMFAEMFEKYAMDGKAPSPSLQDAFNSFRTWFTEVYRTIKGVRDIEIPDDVRGVFDRMLATDEEIALAESSQEYGPLFSTAEDMGISDEAFEVYKRSIVREHNNAVAKESSKLLAAMKRDQLAWWKEEEAKEEAQVRLEAYELKVYNARARLANNKTASGLPTNRVPLKIDRDSLLELLRGDEKTMKMLPHTGQYGVYRRKGGTHVDIVALELGYKDGLDLVNDLLRAPDMETWIAATTKERMREKYPDPFKDASLAGAAIKAVHSTGRASIIAAEMRAVRKLMRDDKPVVRATERRIDRERREARDASKGTMPKRAEVQMIRRAAAEKVASEQIRKVKPHVYLNAERKAGRNAHIAMERGDFEAAYNYKRQQLVNFEMYRAAVKAGDRVAKDQRYLSKFAKRKVQERMGKGGVLNQILGILEGTDLKQRSLSEVDYLEAMKDLREAVDEGRLVVKPETLALIKSELVNWQNLTVEQFSAMTEIVKQLEHEADRTEYAYLNDEKFKLDDIVTELEESIYDNNDSIDLYGGKKGKGRKAKELKDQAIKTWLRPGTLARILDGAGWGSFTKRFIVPIRRAYSEKYIPQIHEMQQRMADIYLEHFSLKDLQFMSRQTIEVQGHSKKYSKQDALALAMNQGNEGNKRAVAGSLSNGEVIYPQHMIDTLLGTLTAKDWQFVQSVWDYYEEFWPAIKEAEERRRGIAPERVEAVPFTVRTADGQTITLRGGYHPIAFDHTLSDQVKQDEFQDISEKMGLGVYVTANTRSGATYERVKNHGLPVRLDLNVIDIHLRDVIRDLALGDEVNAIQRVINDKRFRAAMRKTDNLEAIKVLNLWLTDAAVGEMPANHISTKAARFVRGGFVKAKLGLSATVTLLQFTGFFQSMAAIGTKTLGIGTARLASNPRRWWKYVQEESAFIKARYDVGAWNAGVQDVQSHIDSWFGYSPTIAKRTFNFIGAMLFVPIKYAQKIVDVSTWLGGYEQARNEQDMAHEEAVLYADAMVENAQTSGFFSDRSPLERGTLSENVRQAEFIRIWTSLIGYMQAKGNIAYEKTGDLKYKKPSTWLPWLMDMMLLFTLEGMASAIIYGNWPEEDEEDGERQYGKWAAQATIDSMVSGVPFIREIPSQRYGSGSTPIGALAKDSLEVWDQVLQGETDEALTKSIIDILGYTHVVPSAQMNRTLQAIWDEDETTLLEYATGPRDEE